MKKYFLIIGAVIMVVAFISVKGASIVIKDYDTARLSTDFGNKEAYEIGANVFNMPIFKDHDAAFEQALVDYKEGIASIAKESDLEPINQNNYKRYKILPTKNPSEDEAVFEQKVEITKFLDIYENSFETIFD
ncbi:hypothetical protein [Bacillus sp. JJ722]|uniref:hypothetical protein n=1 Tax=Bacillus sp. JJ722 TaxID=3122973 RepID=UPI003000E505